MPTGQLSVLDVKLTYCAVWGYGPRAVSLTANILNKREVEYFIRDFQLIPSDGGRYEFEVNGELLYSKKKEGRHANEGEIEAIFDNYIKQYAADNAINIPDFDD